MNQQIVLAQRPKVFPKHLTLNWSRRPFHSGRRRILVRTLYLSLDPYMRGRMNDAKSYAPPVKLGEVMVGGVVARSPHPASEISTGDFVEGFLGWQTYALSDARVCASWIRTWRQFRRR